MREALADDVIWGKARTSKRGMGDVAAVGAWESHEADGSKAVGVPRQLYLDLISSDSEVAAGPKPGRFWLMPCW